MKILNIVILCFAVLMVIGCSSTQRADSVQTGTVNEEKAAADDSAKQVSAPKQDLKDIVGMMPKYTADYDVTAGGETTKITMIIAYPKFATISETPDGQAKVIFDESSVVSCTDMQGSWQCFKMPAAKPGNVEAENSIKSGAAKTTFLGACSKAGETGVSYEIETDGEKSTVCYTLGGILLEMKSRDTTMTATRISKTVSDDAFTPPAEPQDLSAMMQQ